MRGVRERLVGMFRACVKLASDAGNDIMWSEGGWVGWGCVAGCGRGVGARGVGETLVGGHARDHKWLGWEASRGIHVD